MKTIKAGDQVVGMAMDGETIEVYKVVKISGDGIQVEETSGKLSSGALRVYDEKTVQEILEKDRRLKALKQEIRDLFVSLKPVSG
jgi:phosphate uptake regulator